MPSALNDEFVESFDIEQSMERFSAELFSPQAKKLPTLLSLRSPKRSEPSKHSKLLFCSLFSVSGHSDRISVYESRFAQSRLPQLAASLPTPEPPPPESSALNNTQDNLGNLSAIPLEAERSVSDSVNAGMLLFPLDDSPLSSLTDSFTEEPQFRLSSEEFSESIQ